MRTKGFMLDKEGLVIEVYWHPMGNGDVNDAYFLWKNAYFPEVTENYILADMVSNLDGEDEEKLFNLYKEGVDCQISLEDLKFFVEGVSELLDSGLSDEEILQKLDPVSDDVIAKLVNENFLRVRYGGSYFSEVVDKGGGNNELYFRISSHGYDWRNEIKHFVEDFTPKPDLIHITNDWSKSGNLNIEETPERFIEKVESGFYRILASHTNNQLPDMYLWTSTEMSLSNRELIFQGLNYPAMEKLQDRYRRIYSSLGW